MIQEVRYVTQYLMPMCMYCKHYSWDGEPWTCDAFPDGIPEEIAHSGFIHTKPYEGDNGIQFEPVAGQEKAAKRYYNWLVDLFK